MNKATEHLTPWTSGDSHTSLDSAYDLDKGGIDPLPVANAPPHGPVDTEFGTTRPGPAQVNTPIPTHEITPPLQFSEEEEDDEPTPLPTIAPDQSPDQTDDETSSYPQIYPDDASLYDDEFFANYDPEAPFNISTDQIVIVQHFHNLDDVHTKSMENHKRYAEAHGYKYRPDTTQYIEMERNWNARTLNKAYAILGAMIKEIQEGEQGAKWML